MPDIEISQSISLRPIVCLDKSGKEAVRDGRFQPVRQPDDQTKDRDDQQQPQ